MYAMGSLVLYDKSFVWRTSYIRIFCPPVGDHKTFYKYSFLTEHHKNLCWGDDRYPHLTGAYTEFEWLAQDHKASQCLLLGWTPDSTNVNGVLSLTSTRPGFQPRTPTPPYCLINTPTSPQIKYLYLEVH